MLLVSGYKHDLMLVWRNKLNPLEDKGNFRFVTTTRTVFKPTTPSASSCQSTSNSSSFKSSCASFEFYRYKKDKSSYRELVVNNFMYSVKSLNDFLYWKCDTKHCRAKVKATYFNNIELIDIKSEHNHRPIQSSQLPMKHHQTESHVAHTYKNIRNGIGLCLDNYLFKCKRTTDRDIVWRCVADRCRVSCKTEITAITIPQRVI